MTRARCLDTSSKCLATQRKVQRGSSRGVRYVEWEVRMREGINDSE